MNPLAYQDMAQIRRAELLADVARSGASRRHDAHGPGAMLHVFGVALSALALVSILCVSILIRQAQAATDECTTENAQVHTTLTYDALSSTARATDVAFIRVELVSATVWAPGEQFTA
jgi:hypothetical protein